MRTFEENSTDKAEGSFEELLRATLSLPPSARALLASHLIDSLDNPDQKEIDAAWAKEIERRIREVDDGKVEVTPGDQVLAELRSRLK
jgi:putative addiction module component (TIGR02574 family)